MIGRNGPIVNMNRMEIYIILFSLFCFVSVFASHSVVINFMPYPKEIYESMQNAVIGDKQVIDLKAQRVEQAVSGNVVVYNGSYSIGGEKIVIDLLDDVTTIKFVITDKLKPMPFKTPFKTDQKELVFGSTNKGILLDLSVAPSDLKDVGEPSQKPQKLLAKCFLLTKKNITTHNFSWERKIIPVIEGQPLSPEFTSNFLTPEKTGNEKTYKNAVFQNEVVFFVEDPANADMDIERPAPINQGQKATEDAVLPNVLVRTDVNRVSISKILENLPFLTKIRQAEKQSKNVIMIRPLEKQSTNISVSAEGPSKVDAPPVKKS